MGRVTKELKAREYGGIVLPYGSTGRILLGRRRRASRLLGATLDRTRSVHPSGRLSLISIRRRMFRCVSENPVRGRKSLLLK